MIRLEVRSNGVTCGRNVAQIRLVVFIQRRWDRDNDRVHFLQTRVVGRCRKTLFPRLLDLRWQDPVDIGIPAVKGIDFVCVNIESQYLELLLAEEQAQRQPDVAESNDADFGLAGLYLG